MYIKPCGGNEQRDTQGQCSEKQGPRWGTRDCRGSKKSTTEALLATIRMLSLFFSKISDF